MLAAIVAMGAAVRCRATDLGSDARAFVLLSTGGKVVLGKDSQAGLGGNGAEMGMVGATSAVLKKGAQSVNDVVTSAGAIELQKDAEAFGCITAGGHIGLAAGARCVNLTDTGGQRPELTTMHDAIGEATLFAGVANSQQPAQTLAPIALSKAGMQTITNGQPGLNVIATPSVTLKNGATLTVQGQTGDSDLLLVHGDFKWGPNSSITYFGMGPDMIVVVSGKHVAIGKKSQLRGSIVALDATCKVAPDAQVIGQMVCKRQIVLGTDAQVIYAPTTNVTIP
jgi:hypothetical protein